MPGCNLPKLALAIAPHSPLAAGLSRSHSGTKLRLASFHDRVVCVMSVLAIAFPLFTPTSPMNPPPPFTSPLFALNLIAVLPSPNRS